MKARNTYGVFILAFAVALLFSIDAADVARADTAPSKIGFVDIGKIMRDSKAPRMPGRYTRKILNPKKRH